MTIQKLSNTDATHHDHPREDRLGPLPSSTNAKPDDNPEHLGGPRLASLGER